MSVPDSTAERILQAVRAWLKLASARTPLTDARVRVANEPGPRLDGLGRPVDRGHHDDLDDPRLVAAVER